MTRETNRMRRVYRSSHALVRHFGRDERLAVVGGDGGGLHFFVGFHQQAASLWRHGHSCRTHSPAVQQKFC